MEINNPSGIAGSPAGLQTQAASGMHGKSLDFNSSIVNKVMDSASTSSQAANANASKGVGTNIDTVA